MNRNTPWRTTRGNRLLALASGNNDWYRIRNATASARAQIHIYDEIGFMGKTAQEFIRDLEEIEGPIDLHLNSPGGEVFDGVAIYNTLLARDGVDVYIDGIAASIASVIAMAGENVYISPSAQFMVHNAFAMACGDAEDMREMANRLESNTANIAKIYAARTGQTAEHWLKLMDQETWFVGQEAVDAGLADKVVQSGRSSGGTKVNFDITALQRGQMAARAGGGGGGEGNPENAARVPYHGHFDIQHPPMTGTHAHNHAEFGFGDGDDGIHHHPHTHAGDAHHSHEHMSHAHPHSADLHHEHAHPAGHEHYDNADHTHTHHRYDPDNDGDDDSTAAGDTDHDYVLPNGKPGPKASGAMCFSEATFYNKDYSEDDRKKMAKAGHAMPDGSYPIADAEDLDNAIHAVGRGKNNSHDAIRKHIIKRAKALGLSSKIPESWSESGSSSGASDHSGTHLYNDSDAAAFVSALRG